MASAQKTTQEKLAESTQSVPSSSAAQQSDNVAHALAGAGGGLLSMALTYAPTCPSHAHPFRTVLHTKHAPPGTHSSRSRPAPKSNPSAPHRPPSPPPAASSSARASPACTPASTRRSSASASPTSCTTTGMSGPGRSSRRPRSRPAAQARSSPPWSP